MEIKQSTRIQTLLLNGVEKKALVWMAVYWHCMPCTKRAD